MNDIKLKYLDDILYILKNTSQHPNHYLISIPQILSSLNAHIGKPVREQDARLLLEKLASDGMIAKPEGHNHIILTYKGAFFHGYERQKEIDDLQFEIAKTDQSLRTDRERHLVLGTYGVAAVTLLLIIWEVLKFFVFEHRVAFYCH